ncbi:MAG: YfiR family protein [Pseudomonadota bacterium]
MPIKPASRRPPRLLPALSLALAALLCAPARAQVAEFDLKAAFIFNFAVFTGWPPETLAGDSPLVLCTYAGNSLQGALGALHNKVVNGHRLAVRQLGAGAGARDCHILYLDAQDRERWQQLRKELTGASVLTVADDRIIGNNGAVIALGADSRRIEFDVDLGAARSAHLTLSSKLLHLARNAQ